jgi:hypothetical protein
MLHSSESCNLICWAFKNIIKQGVVINLSSVSMELVKYVRINISNSDCSSIHFYGSPCSVPL